MSDYTPPPGDQYPGQQPHGQQPYGQQPYGQQPYGQPYDQGYMKPHRGAMILTFGILGLVVCVIFGAVAWAMGNTDLREMRAGRMDPSGEGTTQAGRVCGMIGVILAIVGLAFLALFLIGGMIFAASSGSY